MLYRQVVPLLALLLVTTFGSLSGQRFARIPNCQLSGGSNDISNMKTTLDTCEHNCMTDPKCEAYVFNGLEQCYLKSANHPQSAETGTTCGVKLVDVEFNGDLFAHDPSFIKSGKCYYIFSSGGWESWHNGMIPIRKVCDNKSEKVAPLFNDKPAWLKTFTKVEPGMWAPDVNYFNDQYYVYYAGSSSGSRNSAIGVATSKNIEGPYTDHGEVLHTSDGLQYNAIDPDIAWVYENGQRTQPWLVFGSFWEGIKARRLDPKTGKLSAEDTKLYSLASRNGDAIEGSSTAYHNGWYYLFVSFDHCCSGANSNYRVMVGRSKHITGPYVDRNGVDMMKGGGTQILASHYSMRGPGGEDIFLDNGVHRMIHHWYDASQNGAVKFDIVDLEWRDDWPVVAHESKLNYN